MDTTNRMAWENQTTLDMILAEKGGVCVMIGVIFALICQTILSQMGLELWQSKV